MKNNSIQCGCVEANVLLCLPANIVLVNSCYNLLYKIPSNTYIIYSKKGLYKGIIIIYFHNLWKCSLPCWDRNMPTEMGKYVINGQIFHMNFVNWKLNCITFLQLVFFWGKLTLSGMSAPLQSLCLRHTAGCQIS